MGKPTDPQLRLRCVHCASTETPLWRAGPDGPKTLCNACGVRYKKGKLVLYKDDNGNLTAVKREDASPVHVPPASKKQAKKGVAVVAVPVATAGASKMVKKAPAEACVTAPAPAVAKKVKARSRRTNAGQMPGRYAMKTVPEGVAPWRSPVSSPKTNPSSPVRSPTFEDRFPGIARNGGAIKMDEPSPYQFTEPLDESMFPDVACLGIDSGGDSDTLTVLPMAADPSSAEQFSFAFAELGRDASLDIDLPDRLEALRGLVLDRTRVVSASYEAAVCSLSCLVEQRRLRVRGDDGGGWSVEYCKTYIRRFAQEQNVGLGPGGDEQKDERGEGFSSGSSSMVDLQCASSGLMLAEKSAYSLAVEQFRALMDSTELVGFAEACMVELFAEDVVERLRRKGFFNCGQAASTTTYCRDESIPTKSISVPG
eukprot:GFKZ01003005.1.p1 GENE.GFKZ01003005.1~~GFKZ01003005.1.p1  ORF type:complete len:425 (-),score=61.65 GFKZ01003005.1:1164-2438(-)